jgi:hypothetical protein
MSLTSLSIIMAVIVTNIYEKSRQNGTRDNRLPRLIRVVFLKQLPRYLGMTNKTKELYELLVNLKNKEKDEARLRSENVYVDNSSYPRMNTNTSSNSFASTADHSPHAPNLIQMIAFGLRKRRKERVIQQRLLHLNNSGQGSYELDSSLQMAGSGGQCCANLENDGCLCSVNEVHGSMCSNLRQMREHSVCSADRTVTARASRDDNTISPVWVKREVVLTTNANSKQCVVKLKYRNSNAATSENSSLRQRQLLQSSRPRNSSFEAETREMTSEDDDVKSVTRARREKFKTGQRLFKIKPANLSLYIGYEYVLFSLVLDRCFFWFYAAFTVLGYITTLYIVPFWLRAEKKDYSYLVP